MSISLFAHLKHQYLSTGDDFMHNSYIIGHQGGSWESFKLSCHVGKINTTIQTPSMSISVHYCFDELLQQVVRNCYRQTDRQRTNRETNYRGLHNNETDRTPVGAGQLSQCFSLSRRSMVLFFHVLPMYDNVHCINNLVIRPIKICSVSFSHVN